MAIAAEFRGNADPAFAVAAIGGGGWLFGFGVSVLTFAFFVPANTAFASGTMDGATGAAKLGQWLTIHYFRIGFGMAAAVFGCLALRV